MNINAIKDAIETGERFDSYRDTDQIEQVLRWKILDALQMKGQQLPETNMKTICKKVGEVILRDYPSLTDKEFELVLESGLAGKLGKETWVNGAGILQWLEAYKINETRLRAIEEPRGKVVERKTKEEINALNEKAFQTDFQKGYECFKKNGTIFHKEGFGTPQWPSIIYQEFRNRSVIPKPTQEQIDYAEKKARIHRTIHPILLKTNESKETLNNDIVKSYLLEAYYKEHLKSVTTSDIINNNF